MDDNHIPNIVSYRLDPNQFDNIMQDTLLKSFSICHVNIRSLQKNIHNLHLMFDHTLESRFDIIALSEVWNVSNTDIFSLRGYSLEVKCRESGLRGGGVGAYIRSSLKYNVLNHTILFAESLWMDITIGKRKVIIGIIYRKPNTDLSQFQNSLLSVLDDLSVDKSNILLLGDFNVNLLPTSIDAKSNEFLTSLETIGLDQIVTSPTRITKDSSSLIDHIYTNISNFKMHSGLIETDISDHFPVFVALECPFNVDKNGPKKKTARSYRAYDKDLFTEDLAKIDWSKVYRCIDVDNSYLTFNNLFKEACDKHAPFKTITIGRKKNAPRKPWVTPSIVKSIRKKHKLYSAYRTSNFDEVHAKKYKKYRNILGTVLKNAKRMYYSKLFDDNKNDSGKTWKTINELLNGGNISKKNTEVEKLVMSTNRGEKIVQSEKDIANSFNDFFVNIGPKLAEAIPAGSGNHMTYLSSQNDNSLIWVPVTAVEIYIYLQALDNKKAHGFDNLPIRMLKDAAHIISKPLSYIFNLSLENGVFPDFLKTAKVTPIYKKGS